MSRHPILEKLFPVLLAYALLIVYMVPVAAKAGVDRAKTSESTSVVTMQLMKTEGDVSITNDRGKEITFLEKMKLYSGYHVETQEESYAWINLDGTKLTKLDAVSEMEVRKSSDGEDLEILLNSGNLFFNVSEPLTDDETLKVRTSTMTVGIRGTSGWVEVNDRGDTRVYILEGTVECGVTDPVSGQTKETDLSGSEMADFLVYPQEQEGDKCDIIRYGFTEDDINGFVRVEAVQDEKLCRKIYDACGLNLMPLADEAEQRLRTEQEEMHEKLQDIEERLAEQENNVSVEPVWGDTSRRTDRASASKQMSGVIGTSVNGSDEADSTVLEKMEDAEKSNTTEKLNAAEMSGSDENESGSDYLGGSHSAGNVGNTDELGNLDDLWSLVDLDIFENGEISGGITSTGKVENSYSSGGSDSSDGAGADDTEAGREDVLYISEATVEKIKEVWEKYDTVTIMPDKGSSSGEWTVAETLNVPWGKNLTIDSGVKVTGDFLECKAGGRIDSYGEIAGRVDLVDAAHVEVHSGTVNAIYTNGGINRATVIITGGTVENLTQKGSADVIRISGSGAVKNMTQSGGTIEINSGGTVENLTQFDGRIIIDSGADVGTLTQRGNVKITDGTVQKLMLKDGTLTIESGAVIIDLVNEGGTIVNDSDSSGYSDNTDMTSDIEFNQSDIAPEANDSITDETDSVSETSFEKEYVSSEEELDLEANTDQDLNMTPDSDPSLEAVETDISESGLTSPATHEPEPSVTEDTKYNNGSSDDSSNDTGQSQLPIEECPALPVSPVAEEEAVVNTAIISKED